MKNITVTVGGWLDSLSTTEKNRLWKGISGNADEKGWNIRMAGQHWSE